MSACGVCMGHSPYWDGHSPDCKIRQLAEAEANLKEADRRINATLHYLSIMSVMRTEPSKHEIKRLLEGGR